MLHVISTCAVDPERCSEYLRLDLNPGCIERLRYGSHQVHVSRSIGQSMCPSQRSLGSVRKARQGEHREHRFPIISSSLSLSKCSESQKLSGLVATVIECCDGETDRGGDIGRWGLQRTGLSDGLRLQIAQRGDPVRVPDRPRGADSTERSAAGFFRPPDL